MNKTSIALGYFDSIHLAHKEILKSCANFSPKTTSLALSFTIDDNLLKHKNSHIISTDDKIKMIQDIGIDRVELPLFSKIANLTADEFFYDILLKKYSAVNLVCGFNYTFGKNALGDTNYLLKLCKKNNISLEIIPQIKIDGISVSTSNIKKFLSDGNIKMANKFLGYTFFLKGEVVKGNKIGRTLDFPTINQNFFENQYIPKYGVYKTSTIVDGIT
ncbi:MAG: riboflavin kinase, partial [Oscillospiraceae bacterium]